MFRIVADEIWYKGEVFAKIVMPLSVIRDMAESQIEVANADLENCDSVDELVEKVKADARTDTLSDAENCVDDLMTEFAEKIKEKLGNL